jgi:hypothetical protein
MSHVILSLLDILHELWPVTKIYLEGEAAREGERDDLCFSQDSLGGLGICFDKSSHPQIGASIVADDCTQCIAYISSLEDLEDRFASAIARLSIVLGIVTLGVSHHLPHDIRLHL